MSKVLWFLGILFFGTLTGVALYASFNKEEITHKRYAPSPLTVVIDWEITKPFQLQIFYKTLPDEEFNEKKSIRRQVAPVDKHIEIVLPVQHIYNFRLDFGSAPEHITLYNVEVKGDIYLNFNQWNNYVYQNFDKIKIKPEDNALKLYSLQKDPYMFFDVPFLLDAQK